MIPNDSGNNNSNLENNKYQPVLSQCSYKKLT